MSEIKSTFQQDIYNEMTSERAQEIIRIVREYDKQGNSEKDLAQLNERHEAAAGSAVELLCIALEKSKAALALANLYLNEMRDGNSFSATTEKYRLVAERRNPINAVNEAQMALDNLNSHILKRMEICVMANKELFLWPDMNCKELYPGEIDIHIG